MKREVKIIDNFLNPQEFALISQLKGDPAFDWKYASSSDRLPGEEERDWPQLTHVFQDVTTVLSSVSNTSLILSPLLYRLNVAVLLKAKANITAKATEPYHGNWHTDAHIFDLDFDTDFGNVVETSVYYLDDSNGATEMEDGTMVESKANRIAIFPACMKHRVHRNTEGPQSRFVININSVNSAKHPNPEVKGRYEMTMQRFMDTLQSQHQEKRSVYSVGPAGSMSNVRTTL